jgi:oligosaccharide repeat unit polymerase
MPSAIDQNIPLSALIAVLTLSLVLLCRKSYTKWLNPITIISIWWGGWLAVAELNLIGIPAPSSYTVSVVLVAMISCCVGALTGRRYRGNRSSIGFKRNLSRVRAQTDALPVNISTRPLNSRIANYVAGCLLLIAGPVLWFSYLGWSLQASVVSIADFRSVALEGAGVYGSVFGYLLYHRLIAPLLFCCIVWLQCRGFSGTTKEKWLGFLVVILVMAESIGSTGRSLPYFLLIGIGYSWIFRAHRSANSITGWTRVRVWLLAIPLVIWLIWMNQQRLSAEGVNLLTLSTYFTVWYHTTGFSLLDLELNDPASRLNEFMTFGQASFGGLVEYFILILRPFIRYESVSYLNGFFQSQFQTLGFSDLLGAPIFGNAYYTVLYSLFQDFSWAGIVGGGFLYGRLLNRSYRRYIRLGDFANLYLLNALLYCGVFGLFQSPLESSRFWFAIFAAFLISRIRLRRPGRARRHDHSGGAIRFNHAGQGA